MVVAGMNTRRTTLIVAIVLAVGAGWLTLAYLSNLQKQSYGNAAPVDVVVAAQEIPARVPITPAMLTTIKRPASAVDPNAVHDPKQAVGALSLITIPAGASVTSAMIGNPSDVGLPVRLAPGMRAVSVQIDKVKGISGLIQPGDRVDVIAEPPKLAAAPPLASAILRGIRVLAIGDTLEYSSATPSPQEANATTVTLEVTPKQVDLLVMADLNTTLRLALRSPREPLNSEPTEALHFEQGDSGASASSAAPTPAPSLADAALLKTLLTGSQTSPSAVRAGAQDAAPRAEFGIPVIEGDHYTGGRTQ
jgi:pilus assembly protein CpaB